MLSLICGMLLYYLNTKSRMGYHEQFENLGQNGTFYHRAFDEWTDIRMHMYVVVLNQNTSVVGKTLF